MKEAKVLEFLTLKQDFLSVHEYEMKFTQLSHYARNMVNDIRSRLRLFVAGLGCLFSNEGREKMLIVDIKIYGLC